MRLLSLLIVLAILPVGVSAQSLGDAARREEERRQKNKEKGVKAPLFDDSKFTKKVPASPTPTASPDAAPAAAAPVPPASPRPDDSDAEAEQRKQQEELWRGRMAEARNRRDEAKRKYDKLNAVSLGPNEVLVDEQGRVLVRDLEHLRQLVAQAKAGWDATEQAIEELEDAARRAGALPGWLR